MKTKSAQFQVYNETVTFIEQCNDIETLKTMLIEAIDNSTERTILADIYFNHVKVNKV